MGGRGSKVKTSLLLGEGEGLMFSSRQKQAEHGFGLPGYELAQLVSLIREVDDGSLASWVYCAQCLVDLMAAAWVKPRTRSNWVVPRSRKFVRILDGLWRTTWSGSRLPLECCSRSMGSVSTRPQLVR